jgi:hypothetical protein
MKTCIECFSAVPNSGSLALRDAAPTSKQVFAQDGSTAFTIRRPCSRQTKLLKTPFFMRCDTEFGLLAAELFPRISSS